MVRSEDTDGSELITRLRQQTDDNKEKNAKIVMQKTMLNDQVRPAFCRHTRLPIFCDFSFCR